jgi:hypothetical protein
MRNANDLIWRGLAIATVIGGGLVAIGCTSRITGNEGNLEFSYTTDDLTSDFNKPIAVGAKLDVKAQTAGERQTVDILDVFTDEDVLIVDSFSGDSFILVGNSAGNSLVEVEVEGPDGTVTDSVNMRAAVPEVLKMRHTCTGNALGLYPAGREDVLIPFDMELADGTQVIGYGYQPVELEAGLGTLETTSTDQANFHIDLGATAGDYALTSSIDETSLTVRLIEEAQITGASLNDDSPNLRVIEGETNFIYVWPTVDENLVCQARADMTVASLTPAICDVRNNETPEDPGEFANTEGFVAIEGIAAGECQFDVTFPNGNDGAGATTMFTAQIGTFPGEM